MVIIGVALFAALMMSLFTPLGPALPVEIVGASSILAVLGLVVGLFSSK